MSNSCPQLRSWARGLCGICPDISTPNSSPPRFILLKGQNYDDEVGYWKDVVDRREGKHLNQLSRIANTCT